MSNLKALYKLLPDIKCPDGCVDCCSQVYMLPSEAKALNLEQLHTGIQKDFKCSLCNLNDLKGITPKVDTKYLKEVIVKQNVSKTPSQGCMSYFSRPFICRFFGIAKSGPFSCSKVISGDLLSEEETWKLLMSYSEIILLSGNEPSNDVVNNIERHDEIEHLKGNLKKRNHKQFKL